MRQLLATNEILQGFTLTDKIELIAIHQDSR